MPIARAPRSLLALTLLVGVPVPATAQLPDHLKCHRVRDGVVPAGTADLAAVDPTLSAEGCRLGKPRLFCSPVDATVTPPPPRADIHGQALTGDYVCYKLRCPERPEARAITDRFGAHAPTGFQSSLLCVPAVQGTPPAPGTRCCQTSLAGLCTDVIAADAPTVCSLIGGTLAADGLFCAPGAGCGPTKTNGPICCECPRDSPPFPNPQICFEGAGIFLPEPCPPDCTPHIGELCGPATQSCGGL